MESLFKDAKISKFLSHYPTNQWINMLKVLIHHSLHLLMMHYQSEYPTVNELLLYFEKTSATNKLFGDITDLYWNMHKVSKKLKKIVGLNIVDEVKTKGKPLVDTLDSIIFVIKHRKHFKEV